MYRDKGSRASVGRQTADALVAVLAERDPAMPAHLGGVARLAERTAERLGLPPEEVRRIGLAAELHDVGKAAIPETIQTKSSPLDDAEWAFMRRHTLIGERIVLAAESLAHTAELVRSSHERFDGTGYPDGLAGADIPLGACVIAICDAFDAMTSERPYRAALGVEEALAELRRCAGTQFHPAIVEPFCALVRELEPAQRAAAA
jgi:HD-GYP domain-containing protein (c-di-GMP phosphodiesterase class II)